MLAGLSPRGDVLAHYFNAKTVTSLHKVWAADRQPRLAGFERQSAFSALFVSTFCSSSDPASVMGSLRSYWLKALMDELPIHSYGNCWNTGHKCPRKSCSKVEVAAKYPFHIAFENSWIPGYASEKMHQALALPSVPVVMSAAASTMLPAGSYIDASAFGTPAELAKHLRRVRDSPAL